MMDTMTAATNRAAAIRVLDDHGSFFQIQIGQVWVSVKRTTYDRWSGARRRWILHEHRWLTHRG